MIVLFTSAKMQLNLTLRFFFIQLALLMNYRNAPYCSINYLRQKLEAFQSVHHVTFILCYTVLEDFLALVFALIRVRKHWWDDITQGKQ
ncbi:hypothetical protein DWX83_08665 [Ruminococcus sp. AF21-42]|nr:hypothetical protein DWX83_08665 [Ruminococcus sp. AF21-42]